MATHSNILAWRIPWTEESNGLQSTGSQRVGDDGITWHVQTLNRVLAFLTIVHFQRVSF